MASAAQQIRRLWSIFTIGFALSVLGAIVFLNPTLEFLAVDLIEKCGLPIGTTGNFALYFEAALLVISTVGLIMLGIRHLITKRPKCNP
jgi:nitrate reductase gamma subunit